MSHLDVEDLSAYLDAELDTEDEAAVREHLAACADCQHTLEELRALDRLAHAAPDPALRDDGTDLATRVRARLLAEQSSGRRGRAAWLPAVAGLAAALLLPWLLLQRGREEGVMEPPAPFERPPAPPTVAESAPPATFAAEAAPQGPPAAERKEVASPKAATDLARKSSAATAPPPVPEEIAAKGVEALPAAAPHADDSPGAAEQGPAAAQAEVESRAAPTGPGSRSAGLMEAADGAPEAEPQALLQATASRQVRTAEAARRWREEWRALAVRFAESPLLPRARLGVVEAGALAYRLEPRAEDLERLRQDVQELQRLGAAPEAAAGARILEEAERAASP